MAGRRDDICSVATLAQITAELVAANCSVVLCVCTRARCVTSDCLATLISLGLPFDIGYPPTLSSVHRWVHG